MNIQEKTGKNKTRCIWMQAGVVEKKYCYKNFDCYTCTFDKVLSKVANENKKLKKMGEIPLNKRARIVHWKEKLLKLPPNKRPCIHSMKHKIGFKSCINKYDCVRCEFNQYFEDVFSVFTQIKPVEHMKIKSIDFPYGYYLSPYHSWIKPGEDSTVFIGLDHFVIKFFGPFDEIIPPVIGKRIKKGEGNIVLKKHDKHATILSPVDGIVIEVNPNIWEGNYNQKDPYSDGWIVKAQTENIVQDLKNLMIDEQVSSFISLEMDSLFQEIENICGPICADGGDIIENIFDNIPGLDWKHFCKKFLKNK